VKNLNNKNILVGITGSIAAYKAAQLVSNLKNNGAHVKVIMTKASTSFITERTLESISKNRVLIDESETEESFLHLDVSKWADIILIAPCTANSLNKITNGLGDDLLSTTCLAFKGKIFIAPAMNPNMWNNSILQDNLKNISQR
jgi:phosphopantothenoylcysteine decarboxylase/phosphopantothenate--cysteine ligase